MQIRRTPWISLLAAGAILALAIIVRVECACDEPWIDEYLTGWTIAPSWSESLLRAELSNQTAAHTGFLYVWTQFFGNTAASIRTPSVVIGVLIVLATGLIAARWTGRSSAGCLAGFLAAIDQQFVFYASEARVYVWIQLLGLLGTAALIGWLRDRGRRWLIAWWILSVVMFYSHLTSLFVIAAQAIVATIWLFATSRFDRRWWIGLVATIAVCIPGLLRIGQLQQQADAWGAFSSLPEFLRAWSSGFLLYVLPGIVGLVWSWRRGRWARATPIAAVLGIYLLGIGLVALVAWTSLSPIAHFRYAIGVAGLGPIVAAGLLASIRRAHLRWALAIIIGVAGWLYAGVGWELHRGILQPPLRMERWSELVRLINEDTSRDSFPVWVFPNLIEDHRARSPDFPRPSYFLAPLIVWNRLEVERPIQAFPSWHELRFGEHDIDEVVRAGGVWLVVRGGNRWVSGRLNGLAFDISQELSVRLGARRQPVRLQFVGPPESDVQLVLVTVREGGSR